MRIQFFVAFVLFTLFKLATSGVDFGPSITIDVSSLENKVNSEPDTEHLKVRTLKTGNSQQISRKKTLQRLWHEWNYCTNALSTDKFTPMTEVVPPQVLFLAAFDDCDDLFHSRSITIEAGKKYTIFFPLFFGLKIGYADDYKLGLCGSTTKEGAERIRQQEARDEITLFKSDPFQSHLHLTIDGEDVPPLFIRDDGPYNLIGCSDGRTIKEYQDKAGLPGDACDAEPYAQLNGLDAYPMYGWWGYDSRKWKKGETHTFEFGNTEDVTPNSGCFTVSYKITAK